MEFIFAFELLDCLNSSALKPKVAKSADALGVAD